MKVINFKLLIVAIILITSNSFAQQKSVRLELTIKVDNIEIPDTSYVLDIINYNTFVDTHVKVSNVFILYLDYNTEFEISVSYKGTNIKSIIVNTTAPEDDWYVISIINLNTDNNKRILIGGIKYDEELETFKKYKY
jgi:hypothetical protein